MPTVDEVITNCRVQKDLIDNQLVGEAKRTNGLIDWHDSAGQRQQGKPEEAIAGATGRLAPMKSSVDLMWQQRMRQYAESLRAGRYSEDAIIRETTKLNKLGLSDQLTKFLLAADPFVQKLDKQAAAKAGETVLKTINTVREAIAELPGELLPDLVAVTQAVEDRLNAMTVGQRDPAARSSTQRMVKDVESAVSTSITDSQKDVLDLAKRFMESDGALSIWWGMDLPKMWTETLNSQSDVFGDPDSLMIDVVTAVDLTFRSGYGQLRDTLIKGYNVPLDRAEARIERIEERVADHFANLTSAVRSYDGCWQKFIKNTSSTQNVLNLRQAAWQASDVLTKLDDALEDAWFDRPGTKVELWKSPDPGARDGVVRSFLTPKAGIRGLRERLLSDVNYLGLKLKAA
jgi:hypothetical protein